VLCIDIARVENGLVEVLSCAQGIIVKGQNGNVARHDKVLVRGENKRRKTTHILNSPSSKIPGRDKYQENENDENPRTARISREKVDAHRDPFLTHPFRMLSPSFWKAVHSC